MKYDSIVSHQQPGITHEHAGGVSQTRLELDGLVAIHVRCDGERRTEISIAPDDRTYFLWINLGASSNVRLWLGSKQVDSRAMTLYSSWVARSAHNSSLEVEGQFEAMVLGLSAEHLDDPTVPTPPLTEFYCIRPGNVDAVTGHLCSCLAIALGTPGFKNPHFLNTVMRAMLVHFNVRYGRHNSVGASDARGRLAGWQESRVKELMAARIDTKISLQTFADECGLSVSHFSYLFKRTTGLSPYRYLLNVRLMRARDLMQKTPLTLLEIALSAGFGSQIQFNRIFVKTYGVSPGTWRRENSLAKGQSAVVHSSGRENALPRSWQ